MSRDGASRPALENGSNDCAVVPDLSKMH